jgi:hypothetical protein
MKDNFDLIKNAMQAAEKGPPLAVISSLLLAIEIIRENEKIPSIQIEKMAKKVKAAVQNLNLYH